VRGCDGHAGDEHQVVGGVAVVTDGGVLWLGCVLLKVGRDGLGCCWQRHILVLVQQIVVSTDDVSEVLKMALLGILTACTGV